MTKNTPVNRTLEKNKSPRFLPNCFSSTRTEYVSLRVLQKTAFNLHVEPHPNSVQPATISLSGTKYERTSIDFSSVDPRPGSSGRTHGSKYVGLSVVMAKPLTWLVYHRSVNCNLECLLGPSQEVPWSHGSCPVGLRLCEYLADQGASGRVAQTSPVR